MRLKLTLVVVCLFLGKVHPRDIPEGRNKRFALQSCTTTPGKKFLLQYDRLV